MNNVSPVNASVTFLELSIIIKVGGKLLNCSSLSCLESLLWVLAIEYIVRLMLNGK